MFTEIHIQGYGPIENKSISFSKVNYISGRNGAGKSWLLDLIYFLMGGGQASYQTPPVDVRKFKKIMVKTEQSSYDFFDNFRTGHSLEKLMELHSEINYDLTYHDSIENIMINGPSLDDCIFAKSILYEMNFEPMMAIRNNLIQDISGSGYGNLMKIIPILLMKNILFIENPHRSLHFDFANIVDQLMIETRCKQIFCTIYDDRFLPKNKTSIIKLAQ